MSDKTTLFQIFLGLPTWPGRALDGVQAESSIPATSASQGAAPPIATCLCDVKSSEVMLGAQKGYQTALGARRQAESSIPATSASQGAAPVARRLAFSMKLHSLLSWNTRLALTSASVNTCSQNVHHGEPWSMILSMP